MPWTQTIDAAVPADVDLVSGGATQIRNFKTAILERLDSLFVDFNAQPLAPIGGLNWGLSIAGPPTSGPSGTGAGISNPGTECFDTTNKVCYKNINTKASPTWAPLLLGDSV